MPYRFEFDHEHKILLVVVEGEYGDADLLALIDDLRTTATRLNAQAGITDFSDVTSFTVSSRTIHEAAEGPSPFRDPIPRFVVAQQDFAFGMFRMYKSIGERTRASLQLVRTREEAFAMLGIRNPQFERVLTSSARFTTFSGVTNEWINIRDASAPSRSKGWPTCITTDNRGDPIRDPTVQRAAVRNRSKKSRSG
jgi:hypothetical protein